MTAEEAAKSLKGLAGKMRRAPVNGLRRALNHVRSRGYQRFIAQGGIGPAIWTKGGERKGLASFRSYVARSRVTLKGTVVEGALTTKGIPALVELGGVIKPHFIRNGFGRPGFRMPHPGGPVPRRPWLEPTFSASQEEIAREVTGSFDYEIQKAGLNG